MYTLVQQNQCLGKLKIYKRFEYALDIHIYSFSLIYEKPKNDVDDKKYERISPRVKAQNMKHSFYSNDW